MNSSVASKLEAPPTSERIIFWAVIVLRALFIGVILGTVGEVVDYGTSSIALVFAAGAGTACGSLLAFTTLRGRGLALLILAGFAAYRLFWEVTGRIFTTISANALVMYTGQLHLDMLLGVFTLSALAAWLFWRFRHWITAEIIFCCMVALALLAGHRNYRFDSPQLLNSIAWSLRVDPLTVLVSAGVGISFFLLLYLFIATIPGRPTPYRNVITPSNERINWWAWGGLALGVILGFSAIARQVYLIHWTAAGSRVSNGVGEAAQSEGLSPLGFHSALGATNQPSAVVRLEGDYTENPFTPMMYLREQALSAFNGRELVVAGRNFDQDVSGSLPSESFATEPDTSLKPRVPLQQSTYLLTEHKLAFAVDFPLSIRPLKNPNPSRFKGSFEAYSMAPAFAMADLSSAKVGDTRWPAETWQHYLTKHSDLRYQQIAESITETSPDPISKAQSLVKFLNTRAIYTLTPNHNVPPGEDPVAPFLFGDLRGYCVHFAHAMVYMLRSVGIPARIGTGYLTDLSQAKDGHILLRMSDRHAWAEVYIQDKGWVPFDVQPEQVESHGESAVDQKLLEELMQFLEPPEEALPKDIAANEPGMTETSSILERLIPSRGTALVLITIFAVLPVVLKSYLRLSWMLPTSTERKIFRLHRAIASRLHDLGIRRNEGETRSEFEARITATLGPQAISTTRIVNSLRFSHPGTITILPKEISQHQDSASIALKSLPWKRRILGAISWSSAIAFILGRKF